MELLVIKLMEMGEGFDADLVSDRFNRHGSRFKQIIGVIHSLFGDIRDEIDAEAGFEFLTEIFLVIASGLADFFVGVGFVEMGGDRFDGDLLERASLHFDRRIGVNQRQEIHDNDLLHCLALLDVG